MTGQMSIFDYIKPAKNELSDKCADCRFKHYLHNGGPAEPVCVLREPCDREPRFKTRLIFQDGYEEVVEYETPTFLLHGVDELKGRHGAIVDFRRLDAPINFEKFRQYCKHQMGSIVFEGDEEASPGCTYKDEISATCWDDWQKCNEQNCPFMEGVRI